jgi:hypothetical protein
VPSAPPGPSSAGPAPATPNWFAPKARPAEAAPPATDVSPEAPASAAPADEDDDWPTRYSWLDDEADESLGEADAPAAEAVGADAGGGANPVPVASAPVASAPAGHGDDPAQEAAAGDTQVGDTSPRDATAGAGVPSGDAPAGDTPQAPTAASTATDAKREFPGTETETEQEPGAAEPETSDDGGESPSAGQAGPAQAAGLVTVLPGVPRYHQPDCVLIRFMPDDEIQRLPVTQAKADGCTPCAACQPAD